MTGVADSVWGNMKDFSTASAKCGTTRCKNVGTITSSDKVLLYTEVGSLVNSVNIMLRSSR